MARLLLSDGQNAVPSKGNIMTNIKSITGGALWALVALTLVGAALEPVSVVAAPRVAVY